MSSERVVLFYSREFYSLSSSFYTKFDNIMQTGKLNAQTDPIQISNLGHLNNYFPVFG